MPVGAEWLDALGEWVLPWDAVRAAPDPEVAVMMFLQATYAAAADLAGWDRADLECDLGQPGMPRAI